MFRRLSPSPRTPTMLWKVLSLLIAHVLSSEAAFASLTPTQESPASSPSQSSIGAVAPTGKSDDSPGKSVVVNWKLTCQHLCGEGYGGPTCGFSCLHQQSPTDESKKIKLSSREHTEVCPTLCKNGLGAVKCHCKPVTFSSFGQDHDDVCSAFCAAADIQLEGCSSCKGEAFSGPMSAFDMQSTTPNWDELCTLWCRMGEGGTLCNCDLPPFV
ncbi:uncharacterized protein LOC134215812 [Armigeres subalbatus]|uniref:uncharacterized protein LOC134215812 n=1 Tax=Armigeres subalbatus TaxID=124917 RepID=UPI002ED3B46A